jgi:hypothetical protein
MKNRQYNIESLQTSIAECREDIQQYEYGDYELRELSDELAAMVYELNMLLGMTDEEYEEEHDWGD